MRVRFAPSPTGYLHIGGARTALYNFFLAKRSGGQFILRIDDTDTERSLVEYEEDIIRSLRWLGIIWDEGPEMPGASGRFRQSDNTENYLEVAQRLLASGRAFCDPEGVIRLRYGGQKVIVRDEVCGVCEFQTQALGSEPGLIRSDGSPTYHLASVVDDIEMGITHIIRGQDHLTNTAKHQLMFDALGVSAPRFIHLPLIMGEDGSKLSKRNTEGSVLLKDFRAQGYLPEAVVNYLALLGWSHPEGVEQFSIGEVSNSFFY